MIDLHRHMTGTISDETWLELYQRDGRTVPFADLAGISKALSVDRTVDLKEYLRRFDLIDLCVIDTAAIQRITFEAVATAAAEGLIYLELRFSPARLAKNSHISIHDAVGAVIFGRDQAQQVFPIQVNLIAGLSRELGVRVCAEHAEVVTSFSKMGLSGIDLLGNELDYPAAWFASIFKPITRRNELGITIHAGEAAGPENVRIAVLELGATRIGHGVRSIDDRSVLPLLKERGVVLEMCPTSNLHTGAVKDYKSHPLRKYFDQGIRVTINTDNPRISGIDLAHEYQVAVREMGFKTTDIQQLMLYACDAAFAPVEQREKIRARIMEQQMLSIIHKEVMLD
jgi:adenosine deaminase